MFSEKKSFDPLLESPIWDHQKAYYKSKKEGAWHQVPFLYTSNKFMANWVGNMIEKLSKAHAGKRIHIVELGAGHAMFSYFLYKKLVDLQVDFHMTITDLVGEHLAYLKALPQWQGLEVSWLELDVSEGLGALPQLDGPTFVIANYFFDSLPNAGYRYVDGDWQEALLATTKNKSGIDGDGDLSLSFDHRPCKLSADISKLLSRYEGRAEHVLVPTKVFDVLSAFNAFSDSVYLFVNDKGYSDMDAMNYGDNYAYTCDGAMATMVNFDAIQYWVNEAYDGFTVSQHCHQQEACLTVIGLNSPSVMQRTLVEMAFSGISWGEVFNLFMGFEKQSEMSFSDCCFYIKTSGYDEAMLARVSQYLIPAIRNQSTNIVKMKPILAEVLKSFYWHPGRAYYFFIMLDVMLLCQESEGVLKLLNVYKHVLSSQYDALYRQGIAHYQCRQFVESQACFDKALKLNQECPHSKRYIELMS